MEGRQRSPTHPPESPREAYTRKGRTEQQTVPAADLLELLGDEYTRRVLYAVTEQPRTGREIIDAADVSKATAYRRLDRLQDAGLVDSETEIDPDGHHRKQFYAVVEQFCFEVDENGYTASVRTDSADAEHSFDRTETERRLLADD